MGIIIRTQWVLKVLTFSWEDENILEMDGGDGSTAV